MRSALPKVLGHKVLIDTMFRHSQQGDNGLLCGVYLG